MIERRVETKDNPMSAARICRLNGWGPGTKLVGDEGYGPTVMEITAIGEEGILGRGLTHKGIPYDWTHEGMWTLSCRDWHVVVEP